MKEDKEIKQYIIDFMNHFGYSCNEIEESSNETPDLLVNCNDEDIGIEIKTKCDDESALLKKMNILKSGYTYEYSKEIKRQNNISKIIGKASKQLLSISNLNYRGIWFDIKNDNPENTIELIKSSLYGKKVIFTNRPEAVNCYYFTNSDFYKYKNEIDFAYISHNNKIEMLINNISIKYHNLLKSSFIAAFKEFLYDPINDDKLGKIFIIDTDIDRSNTDELLKYLMAKYNLEYAKDVYLTEYGGE